MPEIAINTERPRIGKHSTEEQRKTHRNKYMAAYMAEKYVPRNPADKPVKPTFVCECGQVIKQGFLKNHLRGQKHAIRMYYGDDPLGYLADNSTARDTESDDDTASVAQSETPSLMLDKMEYDLLRLEIKKIINE